MQGPQQRAKPLDNAAAWLFASLKSILETDDGNRHALVSGHDIERWLLKTAKAAAVSGNFARSRERLSGAFSSDVAVLDMLEDSSRWPVGAGLYGLMMTGDMTQNTSRFAYTPVLNDNDEIEGMAVNIMGLQFALLLETPDYDRYPLFRHAVYRPGRFAMRYPSAVNWLTMSWEDDQPHRLMALDFVRQVDGAEPLSPTIL